MRSQNVRRRSIRVGTGAEAEPERKRLVPWKPNHTILMIEDDHEMRRMLAKALRRDGYRVIEARNGDEALEWLAPGVIAGDARRMPDVVVSDVRLPYFSGFEILECLKVAVPSVPVILITAFPDEFTQRQAAELDAECVLEKPFELHALRAELRRTLAREPSEPSPGPRL
jgi:DNA-binding response OmpR family regulator